MRPVDYLPWNLVRRAKRRLVEKVYLWADVGAPPGRMHPGGYCIEPYCHWPYHIHSLLGRAPDRA